MPRYGAFDLQRGDQDPTDARRATYGGAEQTTALTLPDLCVAPDCEGTHTNEVALPGHVRRLQTDLRTLGFALVGTPDGIFGRHTEWAVREFQIYAKMMRVAREQAHQANQCRPPYLDRLSSVQTNTDRYGGRVSGVVNAQTRRCLTHWLEQRWRCPVVVQARTGAQHDDVAENGENIWLHDDIQSSAPRMFARDYSRYYTVPGRRNPDDLVVVGDSVSVSYLRYRGPRSKPPNHCWTEAELTPMALTGRDWQALGDSGQSTFRVVRAVSEVECYGHADSLNNYDNAFVSLGPCHWTLGILNSTGTGDATATFDDGELAGYLAYLRHVDARAYEQAFEFFGLRPDSEWAADGATLFTKSQRKYVGWFRLESEDGHADIPQTESDADYFRSWHWAYRLVMAGRTIDGYRQRMWHMARIRVRDIRAVEWPNRPGSDATNITGIDVPATAGQPALTRRPTLGEIFTSERAMAILFRWHIRSPAHIVNSEEPGTRLRNTIRNARHNHTDLDWDDAPGDWTDEHESALLTELRAEAPANITDAIDYLDVWPNRPQPAIAYTLPATVGPLDDGRDSFEFDSDGLPPMPPS